MKNFIKLFIFTIVIAFSSCEEEKNITLDVGPGFVQFDGASASLPEESTNAVTVTVLYGNTAESNTNGINVNFTLEGANASRINITPSNGTLVIPAGETSADITIESIDNIDVDGNLEFTINLSADSDVPVGIAGEALQNVSYAITIIDNDCPIVLEDMQGTYSGTDNWYASAGGPLSVSFAASYDGTTYLTTGLGHVWLANPEYWGEPVVTAYQVPMTIDEITGDVTIPYALTATTTYNGDLYDYYVEGSGKYFPCSNTFEIQFELFYTGKDPVAPYFGVPGFIWKETLSK
tara:strand:+ start:1458 stop:2333 length:876 start_codon:yes stop_codon:yes gene_type:complete